jgi:hypothetical protein
MSVDFSTLPREILEYILLKLNRNDLLYYCSQNIPNIRRICNDQNFRIQYNSLYPLLTADELMQKIESIVSIVPSIDKITQLTVFEYVKSKKIVENELSSFIKNNDFVKSIIPNYITNIMACKTLCTKGSEVSVIHNYTVRSEGINVDVLGYITNIKDPIDPTNLIIPKLLMDKGYKLKDNSNVVYNLYIEKIKI